MLALRSSNTLLASGWTCTRRPNKRRCLSSISSFAQPPYKILFFGADNFSCVTLDTLYKTRKDLIQHLVVVTPPDQRTGRRSKEIHIPPLRHLAESLSIPSISLPKTLLKDWLPPDEFLSSPSPSNLLITASFGHLLPTSLLSRFLPLNALNLHPSMLPKYRGAAPIQWSVINGDADCNWKDQDKGCGVTVQELSRGKFDRGRILGSERIVLPDDVKRDFLSLESILAERGGLLLSRILADLPRYQENAQVQNSPLATLAPKLTKQLARIDWTRQTAMNLSRLQRGIGHQYSLWTTLPSIPSSTPSTQLQLQVQLSTPSSPLRLASSSIPLTLDEIKPGFLFSQNKEIYITTLRESGDSEVEVVKVEKVKKEGGKWIDAREWWNGVKRSIQGGGVQLQ